MRKLQRTLASINTRAGQGEITLIFRLRSSGKDEDDQECPVRIERTPCSRGGTRPWFICPTLGCGRRVAIVYAGEYFACRHCHRLAYPSTREDEGDRAARNAGRIRRRLEWDSGDSNSYGRKPKWMRWHMYLRLAEKHNELMEQSMKNIAKKFSVRIR